MTTTKKLPAAALPAWEAYQAMEQSKQTHFATLRQLEQKYQNGGNRTLAETVHLEKLLQTHSERVAAFVEATRVLKESDRTAHQALVEQLALLNARLGESQEWH